VVRCSHPVRLFHPHLYAGLSRRTRHEAKTRLSKLAAWVVLGEEVVIAKAGKPMARLAPIQDQPRKPVPDTGKG